MVVGVSPVAPRDSSVGASLPLRCVRACVCVCVCACVRVCACAGGVCLLCAYVRQWPPVTGNGERWRMMGVRSILAWVWVICDWSVHATSNKKVCHGSLQLPLALLLHLPCGPTAPAAPSVPFPLILQKKYTYGVLLALCTLYVQSTLCNSATRTSTAYHRCCYYPLILAALLVVPALRRNPAGRQCYLLPLRGINIDSCALLALRLLEPR